MLRHALLSSRNLQIYTERAKNEGKQNPQKDRKSVNELLKMRFIEKN